MQLTETLEELLQLYGAFIIHKNGSEYTITCRKPLPLEAQKIALSINMSMETSQKNVMGSTKPVEMVAGRTTYEYTFANDSVQALRALLFLATEKERYNEFCKSIDNEIEKELGTSEEQV